MKLRVRALLFALVAAAAVQACGSSATTSVTGPTAARCQIAMTNNTPSFSPSGGSGRITVSAARECAWSSAASAAWIEITSGTTGQGDGTIDYRIGANPDPVTRRGAVLVDGDFHADVTQQPAPCEYSVSGPAGPLRAAGDSTTIDMRTHRLCGWTVASPAEWVSANPASGSGDAQISLTVAPNATVAERAVTITVGTEPVSVRQSAPAAPPAPVPPPPPVPAPPVPAPPVPAPPVPAPPTPPAPPAPAPGPAPAPAPAPAPGPAPAPAPAPTPPPPAPPPPPPPPPAPKIVEVSGEIDRVRGSCPAVTFELKKWLVRVDAATVFTRGSCRDLDEEPDVAVTGDQLDNSTLLAKKIEVKRR